MVQNARDFSKQGPDVLGTNGNVNVEQFLDSQRVALLIGHHRDIVETIKIGQSLEIRSVLDQLLSASVEQTNVRVSAHNLLAIQLEDQAQHTVGSGMLGSKVDSVMADLPGVYVIVFLGAGLLGLSRGNACKVGIGGNQARALALVDLGISAGQ
jgi:hypothetical protein